MVRVQAIIDGVAKDKDDVSGADVMDGILWFPFNLIAKNENYKNAMEAADARIATMKELKEDKQCNEAPQQIASEDNASSKLIALNDLYKQGVLTEEEYMTTKQRILDGMAQSQEAPQ